MPWRSRCRRFRRQSYLVLRCSGRAPALDGIARFFPLAHAGLVVADAVEAAVGQFPGDRGRGIAIRRSAVDDDLLVFLEAALEFLFLALRDVDGPGDVLLSERVLAEDVDQREARPGILVVRLLALQALAQFFLCKRVEIRLGHGSLLFRFGNLPYRRVAIFVPRAQRSRLRGRLCMRALRRSVGAEGEGVSENLAVRPAILAAHGRYALVDTALAGHTVVACDLHHILHRLRNAVRLRRPAETSRESPGGYDHE